MTDLDRTITELKSHVDKLREDYWRSREKAQVARHLADKARQSLTDEFGVSTADEARTLLATLERQLEEAVASLQAQLDEMGV